MKKIVNFATILMVSTMLQSQTTIFVTPNGGGDGTTWANACNLETAVVRSLSGAETTEIWVQSGTHYPSKMLVVPASVKIYGGFSGTENNLSERNFSANVTIIDGQQKIGSIFRLENAAKLHDLTIQHGNASGKPHKNGGGVYAENNCVIENCIIRNNSAIANGGGIYAKENLTLLSSTVENNTASKSGADLYGNCITQISTPVILTHPDVVEQSVEKGSNFPALSVSATSTLPLSYQWFSNTSASNENGNNLGNTNGAQTATYTPQSSTVGTLYYYCEITNAGGTTKSKVSGAHIVTAPIIVATGCNANTPNWGTNLGTVTWGGSSNIESSVRTITNGNTITQVWSGPVRTSVCSARSTYAGGSLGNYNADCRVNASNYEAAGDLFSWCAVVRFADVLCPAPWRVPTKDDFMNLDKALGGTGDYGINSNDAVFLKYTSSWGVAYGRFCNSDGTLYDQSSYAFYWSQTEGTSMSSYRLYLYLSDRSYQINLNSKDLGFTLRCVR